MRLVTERVCWRDVGMGCAAVRFVVAESHCCLMSEDGLFVRGCLILLRFLFQQYRVSRCFVAERAVRMTLICVRGGKELQEAPISVYTAPFSDCCVECSSVHEPAEDCCIFDLFHKSGNQLRLLSSYLLESDHF